MGTMAGRRDRKVNFYPRTSSEDALGTESEADGTPVPAWARVMFQAGSERREAGQAGAVKTATFDVLSTAALRAVDERWEIEFGGARWGITDISEFGEADRIEFTAVKKGS